MIGMLKAVAFAKHICYVIHETDNKRMIKFYKFGSWALLWWKRFPGRGISRLNPNDIVINSKKNYEAQGKYRKYQYSVVSDTIESHFLLVPHINENFFALAINSILCSECSFRHQHDHLTWRIVKIFFRVNDSSNQFWQEPDEIYLCDYRKSCRSWNARSAKDKRKSVEIKKILITLWSRHRNMSN